MTTDQSVFSFPSFLSSSLPSFLLSYLPNSTAFHQSRFSEKSVYKAKKPGRFSDNSAILLRTIEGADASDLADVAPQREQNRTSACGLPSSLPTSPLQPHSIRCRRSLSPKKAAFILSLLVYVLLPLFKALLQKAVIR